MRIGSWGLGWDTNTKGILSRKTGTDRLRPDFPVLASTLDVRWFHLSMPQFPHQGLPQMSKG